MDKTIGRTDLRRRALVLAGAGSLATPVLGVGLAGCATSSRRRGPVVQFEQPEVRVGDRWIYREINRYNGLAHGGRGSDGHRNLAADLQRQQDPQRDYRRCDRPPRRGPGGALRAALGGGRRAHLRPHHGFRRADADRACRACGSAGPNTSRTSYSVPGYSGRYRWMQRLKVVGTDRIATPAGNFDCREGAAHDLVRLSGRLPLQLLARRQRLVCAGGQPLGAARMDRRLPARELAGQDGGTRRREDWVRWELVSYAPAAGPKG